MIPVRNQLKRKRDFEILFQEGRFFGGKLFTAKVWRVDPRTYPKRGYTAEDLKIGFVTGLKVSKSAVERNRAKRQMREVVRLLLKDGRIRNGFFAVFVGKPESVGAEYDDIRRDIVTLLDRAGLLV